MATVSPLPDRTALDLPGGGRTMLQVRRSERARRVTLRIIPATGEPELVLPRRASLRLGLRFARDKAGWLEQHLDALPPPVPFADGAVMPLRGEPVTIRASRALFDDIWLAGRTLKVAVRRTEADTAVRNWLRAEARRDIAGPARERAHAIGRRVRTIVVRDTVTRWGSCSLLGDLSFSWRLIFAPAYVLDYMVAHEVAHLEEFNHTARFWAVVDRLTDHADAGRRWLRDHGATLYRYGVERRSW